MPLIRTVAGSLLLAGLLLGSVGCGGDDDDAGAADTSEVTDTTTPPEGATAPPETGATTAPDDKVMTVLFCETVKTTELSIPPGAREVADAEGLANFKAELAAYAAGVDRLAAVAPAAISADMQVLNSAVTELDAVVQGAADVAALARDLPPAQAALASEELVNAGQSIGAYVKGTCLASD